MDAESRAPIFTADSAAAPMATPRRSSVGSTTAADARGKTPSSGPTPSSSSRLRGDVTTPVDTSSSRRAGKLRGQLEVLQNVTTMLSEMLAAAETKADVAHNDVIAEMVGCRVALG